MTTWLRRSERGFTLLELLVVISIIAILAAVVITNLNTARQKANDSKVQTDLNSLAQAVNVATTTVATPAELAPFETAGIDKLSVLETAVTTQNLIKKMPEHPAGKTYHYRAQATNGVLNYILWGELSTSKCFIVANGSSFTGDCTTEAAQAAL